MLKKFVNLRIYKQIHVKTFFRWFNQHEEQRLGYTCFAVQIVHGTVFNKNKKNKNGAGLLQL